MLTLISLYCIVPSNETQLAAAVKKRCTLTYKCIYYVKASKQARHLEAGDQSAITIQLNEKQNVPSVTVSCCSWKDIFTDLSVLLLIIHHS